MLVESSQGKSFQVTVPKRADPKPEVERTVKPNHLNLFEKSSLNFNDGSVLSEKKSVPHRNGPTMVSRKHKGMRSLQEDALKRICYEKNTAHYEEKSSSKPKDRFRGTTSALGVRYGSQLGI